MNAWYPQKRVSGPLELELGMVVSPYGTPGNPDWVLCRNDKRSEPLSPSNPASAFF